MKRVGFAALTAGIGVQPGAMFEDDDYGKIDFHPAQAIARRDWCKGVFITSFMVIGLLVAGCGGSSSSNLGSPQKALESLQAAGFTCPDPSILEPREDSPVAALACKEDSASGIPSIDVVIVSDVAAYRNAFAEVVCPIYNETRDGPQALVSGPDFSAVVSGNDPAILQSLADALGGDVSTRSAHNERLGLTCS